MKPRILLAFLLLPLGLALAAGSRVITVEGAKLGGNLRMGPYEYSGGVKASVQELRIASPTASLEAPQGVEMSKAEGKRTATFEGGAVVTRGRLTANGPSLTYKEADGLGLLKGPVKTVQKPEKADDDDVIIEGGQATFDVDNDTSTSEGDVRFVNGKQSGKADKVVFEEKRELAVMTDAQTVTLVREPRKAGESKLTITSKETRVLTGEKLLIAEGNVTLVSGDNTTTGTALYYDDDKATAYVVGRPARNVNKKNGATVSGGTLVNNTRINQVKIGAPFDIPEDKFQLTGEK